MLGAAAATPMPRPPPRLRPPSDPRAAGASSSGGQLGRLGRPPPQPLRLAPRAGRPRRAPARPRARAAVPGPPRPRHAELPSLDRPTLELLRGRAVPCSSALGPRGRSLLRELERPGPGLRGANLACCWNSVNALSAPAAVSSAPAVAAARCRCSRMPPARSVTDSRSACCTHAVARNARRSRPSQREASGTSPFARTAVISFE